MNESIKKAIAERAELEAMRGAGKKHDHELVVTLYGKVDVTTGEVGGVLSFFRPQDFAVREEWNYWRLVIPHRGLVFLVHGYADVPITEDDMRGLAIDSGFPLMYGDPLPMAPSDGLREDDFWNTEEDGDPRWWDDELDDYYPDDDLPQPEGWADASDLDDEEETLILKEIEADTTRAMQKLAEVRRKEGTADEYEDMADFGPCCACGQEGGVRNVLMLHFKAPMPSTGWGCLQCGLPRDGAVAVVCDKCLENGTDLVYIVAGQIAFKGRMPLMGYEEIPFEHDMSKHPEAEGK